MGNRIARHIGDDDVAILQTTRGFRYPENDTAPDIERDLGNLANDIDGQYVEGLASARPASGKVGRRYRATDTGQESLDIGSAWVDTPSIDNITLERSGGALRVKDAGITAAKLADALKPSGTAGSGTEALRALGTSGTTAAAGNDARLSNQRAPLGFETSLKIIRGEVNANGTTAQGSGFTVAKTGTGLYTISYSFSGAATVTLAGRQGDWVAVLNGAPGSIQAFVITRAVVGGAAADSAFCFIAVGPS